MRRASARARRAARIAPLAAGALLGAFAMGCAAPAVVAPDAPRRPDGVSLDKAPSWPQPAPDATTTDGVATLRTPLGTDVALDVLHAYVRAIVAEDLVAMRALHTSDATYVSTPVGQPARAVPAIVNLWDRRFSRFDYTALAGTVVVREADAQVRRLRTPDEGLPNVPLGPDDEPARELPARGSEVMVRAPVATSRVGGMPVLGGELVLYLRREGSTYKVSALVEDFALP